MTTVSAGLPLAVAAQISDFQHYVAHAYYARHRSWASAAELIERIAEQLSSLVTTPTTTLPLRPITDRLGVRVRFVRRLDQKLCGLLETRPFGFQMTVAWHGAVGPRERFTIAHECGHTLFYVRDAERPARVIPRAPGGYGAEGSREEGLCDHFARALLVRRAVATALGTAEPTAAALLASARELDVSPDVVAMRVLYDVKAWPEAAFYRISIHDGRAKVRAYRGVDAKRPTDTLPTATALEERLAGLTSAQAADAVEHLVRNSTVARHSPNVLWVCGA